METNMNDLLKKPKHKTISISIEQETYDKLKEYCRKHRNTMSNIIDSLVNMLIDDRLNYK